MKDLLNAINNPESVKVTARERLVLKMVKHVMLEKDFIIKQAMYLAISDSVYGQDIARTNLIHRMSSIVRKRMKGKVNGVSRYEQATIFVDVALQLYLLDQAEDTPLIREFKTYGYDGEIKVNVKNTFIAMDLTPKKNIDGEPKLPLIRKCRDTIYRPGHVIGKAWDEFALNLADVTLMIAKYTPELLLKLYMQSSDYNDLSRSESQADRIIRAKAAIKYITEEVCGKPLAFVSVPDSRTRVAKYRIFFADTAEELNVEHVWFINFYGEGWQTALYELYEQYELTEDGIEDLIVAMTRRWVKAGDSQRTSWRKSKQLFKKHNVEILEHCSKDYSDGVYYPRMAKLFKAGVGTMTGFLIEADLSASGIGSAGLNIHSKKICDATALTGSATPSDAHRTVVERVLFSVMDKELALDVIHKYYKIVKKKNTEVTHAQTIDVSAQVWNQLLDDLGLEHEEVTADMLRNIYDEEMPWLLPWIEAITSITQVGVRKGYPVLYFHASDGCKCATSAFAESRVFMSRAVDRQLKSRTIKFQMRMPIEVRNGQIVYDDYAQGDNYKIRNKMMGAWANFIQADDAHGMRFISKNFKADHGYVPIVKHDGYHVKLGHVKSLTEHTHAWRVHQFDHQPVKRAFHEIADFLKIKKIELPEGDMKKSDMYYKHVGEAPFMMT